MTLSSPLPLAGRLYRGQLLGELLTRAYKPMVKHAMTSNIRKSLWKSLRGYTFVSITRGAISASIDW
ncbi:hypothetical protein B0T14DRAFT_279362 [Immersiella caudata]|uniref:Uncharacterized protein n=1 Tax=Immersiella caudata TaxID=314043 RepID=A0AA40BTV7_9PEZI|nr:hypothetical protein B0T14DRAFT_279362 [Immersiella caudata]